MKSRLATLQVGRGIAALLVVVSHAYAPAAIYAGGKTFLQPIGEIGAIGVDMFFIISGFIMVYITKNRFGPKFINEFIWDRLARIVPLYWIVTTIVLIALLLIPKGFGKLRLNDWNWVLYSYLFIPYRNSAGELFPLMPSGWTLSYELYFYVAICVSMLFIRRYIFLTTSMFFITLYIASMSCGHIPVLGSPLFLEFLAGAALATIYSNWMFSSKLIAWLCFILSTIIIYFVSEFKHWFPGGDEYDGYRFVFYGVPAFIFIFSLLMMEQANIKSPKIMVKLGDASYSLYLWHWLIVIPMFKIWHHYGLQQHISPNVCIVVICGASILISICSYHVLEKPITRFLKEGLPRPRLATT